MRPVLVVLCGGLLASAALAEEPPPAEAAPAVDVAPAVDAAPADDRRFGVSIDRKQPLSITSDELEAFKEDGVRRLIFNRNVNVEQAGLHVRSDRLEAFYPKGVSQPDRLIATGNVVVTQNDREARCESATYDRAAQSLVCRGGAELRDGEDRVSGDVIEFDLARETVVVTGGAAVVLHPRPEDLAEEPEGPNG